ncbi:serine hydrolase domain-containing protein [Glycomyces tritici]|uniref:Serine hydrolase domain-containing protein n=1 Tax=Glycomyces tritici TaxID=2665176 RepID=A0ABT7YQY3_9ACTN|nr:serine hydrolase domain-containing protein [Glycomyces tritici]MDN3241057.1 serine hydrolase domain-containing protein [Glycomyces tritici]
MILAAAAAAAVAAGALASPARAQEPVDIEALITEAMDEHAIPGAIVALTSAGATSTYGFGFADLDAETPVDPERTRFPIDSVSKAFTATAIMTLVDDGMLDLDTDVNEYLDEAEVADTYPGEPITLRHLLTHTAGFEESVIGLLAGTGAGDRLEESMLELPERVRPPGEAYAYSNTGLSLAALAAADVLGTDFGQVLAERVFEPLGLDHTEVNTGTADPDRPLATSYALSGGEQVAQDRGAEDDYPAGGIIATAADMGAFMAYHLGDGEPLLSADALAELHGPQFHADPRLPGSALGFHEMYHGSTRLVAHGGDGPGSHSLMTLVPGHDLGIYIAFNADGADGGAANAAEEATRTILDQMLGATAEADGPAGATAPDTAAEAAAGTYRSTRMNESDYSNLFLAMGSDVTVAVADDGTVTTTGLSFDPEVDEQHWEPQGDGLYREADGSRLIAFGTDDAGNTMLYNGDGAYEHLAWYERTDVLLAAAAAGLLLLASLLVWPLASFIRRRSGRPAPRPGSRLALVLAASAGVLSAAFIAIMAAFLADTDKFILAILEGAPIVPLAAIPLALAAVATAAALVTVVLAWTRRWWTTGRRVHYTLAILGAAVFIAVTEYYHFATAPMQLF